MSTDPQVEVNEEDNPDYDPEAEVQTGEWKVQQINLPEVQRVTGEEDEAELSKFRAKIYRWRDAQWKERGVGDLRFLSHNQTKKIRVVMRQDKTLKVIANFYVGGAEPLCQLAPQKTTDKAWVFSCYDNSDEKPEVEKMCVKLTSVEQFKDFQQDFEKYYKQNTEVLTSKKEEPEKQEEPKVEEQKTE